MPNLWTPYPYCQSLTHLYYNFKWNTCQHWHFILLFPVLDESWLKDVRVNLPAVKARAETLGTRRCVKKKWQVWLFAPHYSLHFTLLMNWRFWLNGLHHMSTAKENIASVCYWPPYYGEGDMATLLLSTLVAFELVFCEVPSNTRQSDFQDYRSLLPYIGMAVLHE